MNNWLSYAVVGPHAASSSLAHARRIALAVLCFGPLWITLSAPQLARGESAPAPASTTESSLLVATRETPNTDSPATDPNSKTTDDEALEPVSQTSEHTPDLANSGGEPDGATQFGAALAKVARPLTEKEPSDKATARRAAAIHADSLPLESVKFQDILVGKSTKTELISAWSVPAESMATAEGTVFIYDIEPFQTVEVLIAPNDVISAIKITLAAPLDAKQLAEQLSLQAIEPVTAMDESQQPLGQAFPERGVLFVFTAPNGSAPANVQTTPTVSHVVLQPHDAQVFVQRAESHLHGPYTQNITDLKAAIALDPEFGRAYWLLAQVYLATGQADLADAAAAEACDIEPNNASYQLCRGQALALVGQYDDAVHTVRAILDREQLQPIDRAQALHQMARLAALGDVEIASKAIPFDTRAIEVADTAASSDNDKERRAAKQLLVEAHLAVAEEIARQVFNQKVESLELWVGRASGLAEDYISSDGGSIELRLFVAQRALAALASFKPTLDPAPWVLEADEAAQSLFAQSDDELWQARIKWELGIAYLHALRVEHVRRETEAALRYGQKAIEYLAEGAASRQAVHASEQLVGQLYFQMGAVYAVHYLDHEKAAKWYEKAAPLLAGARPISELYAPRREGEMLVSMGVTFWQLGDQSRALELTQSGVNLVEIAVEDGILAKSTLAVPYGNLATMYQQMGENTNAAKYAELSKAVAPPAPKQPRVGRATTARRNPRATATTRTAAGQPQRNSTRR